MHSGARFSMLRSSRPKQNNMNHRPRCNNAGDGLQNGLLQLGVGCDRDLHHPNHAAIGAPDALHCAAGYAFSAFLVADFN
jgi:hypothetical protein